MSSSMYDRYKMQSDELPGLIKQISQSLEHLAGLVYDQLPFERGERETIEAYKDRLIDYFEKLHAAQVQAYKQLPEDAQHKYGEIMAEQDVEYHALISDIQRGDYEN